MTTQDNNYQDIIDLFKLVMPKISDKTKVFFYTNAETNRESFLYLSCMIHNRDAFSAMLEPIREIQDYDLKVICLKSFSGVGFRTLLHTLSSSGSPCIDILMEIILQLRVEHQAEHLTKVTSNGHMLVEREHIYKHLPSLFPYIHYCSVNNKARFLQALKNIIERLPVRGDLLRRHALARSVIELAQDDSAEDKGTFIQPALTILQAHSNDQAPPSPDTESLHQLYEQARQSGNKNEQRLLKALYSLMSISADTIINTPTLQPHLTCEHMMHAIHHAAQTKNWVLLQQLKHIAKSMVVYREHLETYYKLAAIYIFLLTRKTSAVQQKLISMYYAPILQAIDDHDTRNKLIDNLLEHLENHHRDIYTADEIMQTLSITRFYLNPDKDLTDFLEMIYLACQVDQKANPSLTFKALRMCLQHHFDLNPVEPRNKIAYRERELIKFFYEVAHTAKCIALGIITLSNKQENPLPFMLKLLHSIYEPEKTQELLNSAPASVVSVLPDHSAARLNTLATGPKL